MKKKQNIQMIADYNGDLSTLLNTTVEGEIPILATRNLVLFPGIMNPILVGRKASLSLLKLAEKNENMIFAVFSQKEENIDYPEEKDLLKDGVYAKVLKIIDMPDSASTKTAIIQSLGRCSLETITKTKPYLQGFASRVEEILPEDNDFEWSVALDALRATVAEYIKQNDEIPNEVQFAINNITNGVILVNYVCTNLIQSFEDKAQLLKELDIKKRLFLLLRFIRRELELLQIRQNIRMKTRSDLDEQQREYFLHQQIKNIKEELGDEESNPERSELQKLAKDKKWSKEIGKSFEKELNKLDSLNPQSPEYSVQLNYLQTVANLPWNEYTTDDLSLKRAKRILDQDHYGMEKVKERILEYMAVLQLRGDLKSPILCLYGPPGVGKTSLGKSIAKAMKRNYVRVSLGGLHDEAEIRGHRRTYIGAMPGRIIKSIQKAKSSNPVFILDEIDKVTQNTVNGDPSSALLEVLDPEQNNAFHDNYLDLDYDLSKVLFIATANDLNTIPRPLLDRMEIIEVGGYITEEKIEIAKRHLVPREIKNTGLDAIETPIKFTKPALERIIENYTRESGVRQLEKQINKALRKIAYHKAMEDQLDIYTITPNNLEDLLGKPPFYRDIYQGNDYAGVVTGLAWTSVGGEILFIETSLSKGKAGKLTLTGNLGDVMKESAVIALEYVKAHADALEIDSNIFNNWNIHIHVPEGATPKDGPSAGITIATSIASAITQRKVRKNTAMTGEITLRGKVLPVGGIKEKFLQPSEPASPTSLCVVRTKRTLLRFPKNIAKELHSIMLRMFKTYGILH